MTERTSDASNGWAQTLESANEMTESLRDDGWRVVTVRAAHVAPEPPGAGESDRFGFVYIAPGDVAEELKAAIDDGEFDAYTVFNRREGNDLFTLTRITDNDERIAVLLVGGIALDQAGKLVEAVRDRGEMYSHVQLLDGTHLGTFHHDDVEPFFPEEL